MQTSLDDTIAQLVTTLPNAQALLKENQESTLELIARQIVECGVEGKTKPFGKIFEIIEEQMIYGNQKETKVVIVSLLETIKNESSHLNFDFAFFEEWLGPETFVAWRWLEKKWRGATSLAKAAESSGSDTGQ